MTAPSASACAIRPAKSADVAALVRLESVCFPDPWSIAMLAAELAHPQALVQVAVTPTLSVQPPGVPGSQLLGYACFRRLVDAAELLRLGVAPAHRRRGIGYQLLTAGLAALSAEGIGDIWLEVRADNLPAIALYERLGLVRTGARPRYYPDGCTAWLYGAQLPAG